MKESDYSKIERAIKFLEENHKSQPSLEDAANVVGLSSTHFQKLFTKWAGISPKKFLQFLTVEYIKSQLSKSSKVIDALYDAGLSSTSRIHELFVKVEAISPTEYKTKGKNLKIYYESFESPFGECLLAVTDKGLCAIHFTNLNNGLKILKQDWANAEIIQNKLKTELYFNKIFKRLNKNQPINVILKGTDFQIQVWKALLKTQPGELITYNDIAKSINKPKAVRAVGTAVGSNNISFLIPCHRVINKIGIIGNYRWGINRKKAILGWEAAKS